MKRKLMAAICFCFLHHVLMAQHSLAHSKENKDAALEGAFYTNQYPNLFREAGYKQADIDKKVAKAYYDLFEGPGRVYFEVGDSMGYVSDLKNNGLCMFSKLIFKPLDVINVPSL